MPGLHAARPGSACFEQPAEQAFDLRGVARSQRATGIANLGPRRRRVAVVSFNPSQDRALDCRDGHFALVPEPGRADRMVAVRPEPIADQLNTCLEGVHGEDVGEVTVDAVRFDGNMTVTQDQGVAE